MKFNPAPNLGEILWAFSAVRTDMLNSRTAQPAVIAFPWTAFHPDPIPWLIIRTYFQFIFDLGGTIIVPSGNNALTSGRQDVDTLPAQWESPVFPLIVVGAVDNTGTIAPFSQGPTHVTVWAPGVQVQCARRYGFRTGSGTSHSTGMVCLQVSSQWSSFHWSWNAVLWRENLLTSGQVAGLAAYGLALQYVPFVSSINTPILIKNWLSNTASWVRQPPNGPRVIWNTEQG